MRREESRSEWRMERGEAGSGGVARLGGIFTERLKAENGKWEAEIEWREKRDVSRAMEEGRGRGKTNRAGEEEEREREGRRGGAVARAF